MYCFDTSLAGQKVVWSTQIPCSKLHPKKGPKHVSPPSHTFERWFSPLITALFLVVVLFRSALFFDAMFVCLFLVLFVCSAFCCPAFPCRGSVLEVLCFCGEIRVPLERIGDEVDAWHRAQRGVESSQVKSTFEEDLFHASTWAGS